MEDQKLEAKFRELLSEYAKALHWTREKLKETQSECQRLKLIIWKISEGCDGKEDCPDDFDP